MTGPHVLFDGEGSPKKSIIDVRSPCEYTRGSVPGAKNIWLFDDAGRADVGTLYKKKGRLAAIQRGLELVAGQMPRLREAIAPLLVHDGPMFIYCARGGMRSRAVGTLVRNWGKPVSLLEGGYKRYRNEVLRLLQKLSQHHLLVLNGRTGSGKTAFLRELTGRVPTIDFEGLACHRGSAFGDFNMSTNPPTQQNFENLIAQCYYPQRFAPRILVESSRALGPVRVPSVLVKAMERSPVVLLSRKLEDRVAGLKQQYLLPWDDTKQALFEERLELLKNLLPTSKIQELKIKSKAGQFEDVINDLLKYRYDRSYDRSLQRLGSRVIARFDLTSDARDAKNFVFDNFGSGGINEEFTAG